MRKAVIVAEDSCVSEQLAADLNVIFERQVSFETVSLLGDIVGNIKAKAPDLLLTIDLAGFDRETLTDNIAYNLLDCKQVHVISKLGLANERYLGKALSIAMFFACAGEEQKAYLLKKYTHIPWLKCVEKWKGEASVLEKENVKEIYKMIEKVIRECRLD